VMPWPVCSALRGGRLDNRRLTRRASKPARGGWRPSILGRRPQRGLDGSLLVGGVRRARNAPAPVRAKHSYRYGLITASKNRRPMCRIRITPRIADYMPEWIVPIVNIELNENMEFACPPSIPPSGAQRALRVGRRRVSGLQISRRTPVGEPGASTPGRHHAALREAA